MCKKIVLILNWIVWNRTVYMSEMDLALNNLQWLIRHKTKPKETHTIMDSYLDAPAMTN